LSGLFEGRTTGAPISILIWNRDAESSHYEPIKNLLRPGHANFTYLEKYGIFDHRGGGRASARETACRVAAGAVAKKLLAHHQIQLVAYVKSIGDIVAEEVAFEEIEALKIRVAQSPLFCPDERASQEMMKKLEELRQEGDSLGGTIELVTSPLPVGLGDPLFEKLEANLARAMLSLPASKGFEIGSGFRAAAMRGSEHNDLFTLSNEGKIVTQTNHAGGTLGGISTGMPLMIRVAFKPTSSIRKSQQTLNLEGEAAEFNLPEGSRHDPCVALRAAPVVEAMGGLVLVDALLMHRCAKKE
jgi:chorismate synthase